MAFGLRLKKCAEAAGMSVADLSVWFSRPYATVRVWHAGTYEPWAPFRKEALDRLFLLERLVKAGKHLPIPVDLSPSERRDYITRLKDEQLNASVSKAGAAG